MGCRLEVDVDNNYTVRGNQCKRGVEYAKQELLNPTRIVTSTIKIKNGIYNRIPVKTDKPISKYLMHDVMDIINRIEVEAPIALGTIVSSNILDTDVNIVVSRSMQKK
jgi:CxxC motif-containing protein